MELFFVTLFPSFRPTKLAMRVCPRAFGGRICAGRCALLGHSQDDCLHAISPTRNISILASHELQPRGKSQSHVSTDFSPLGQAVHQVGTAPALSEAQLSAGFHWPEWAEFKNGTSGSIARTLANEWLFRRMYLRTHTHTQHPLARPDAVPCSKSSNVFLASLAKPSRSGGVARCRLPNRVDRV